jgi:hypothetical protein
MLTDTPIVRLQLQPVKIGMEMAILPMDGLGILKQTGGVLTAIPQRNT